MPECKTIKHNYDIGVITHEVKVWFRIFLKELIHKEVGWTIWLPLDSVPFVGFHPLWGSVHTLGYVQNRRDQFLDQIDRFVPTIASTTVQGEKHIRRTRKVARANQFEFGHRGERRQTGFRTSSPVLNARFAQHNQLDTFGVITAIIRSQPGTYDYTRTAASKKVKVSVSIIDNSW